MESAYQLSLDNPMINANWFSKIFFGYLIPLLRKGKTKNLEVSDLYKTLKDCESCEVGCKLEKLWNTKKTEAKGKQPSMTRCLLGMFGIEYFGWGMLFFFFTMLNNVTPLLLASLIQEFSKQPTNTGNMCLRAGTLVLITVVGNILHHHSSFGMSRCGIRIKAAISTLLYRKILRLNQNVLGRSTSSGQIINLLSNDLARIDVLVQHLNIFWILPIEIGLTCYLIWTQVGISALAGILTMTVFSLPIQGYLSKLAGILRLKIAEKTDRRVRMMSEIVNGIQVIKMYTWEKPFEEVIHHIRKSEVGDLTQSSYLIGFYSSCIVFLERLSLFSTVACYALLGNALTPDKVFSMAQFFNILQTSAAVYYPLAVTSLSQSRISIKRIQHFLALEEKQESNIEKCSQGTVSLNNVSAAWIKGVPVLKNITLNLKSGALCAIVGPVGAGKSSIIQILLGELPFSSGTTKVGGDISYASQQPWLFSATVRQNIIFGQEFDRKRYKKVVKVCALKKDFQQFPYGDHTLVGDRGSSLSGGQKARINLARAVYRQASIYLLDDPLSAVDAHVGKHLFNKCIYTYLRGTLRILVTHQLQHLMKADVVVVVNNGEIEAVGTYNELASNDLDFSKLLKQQESEDEKDIQVPEDGADLLTEEGIRSSIRSTASSINSTTSDILEMKQFDDIETETVNYQINSPLKEYIKASGNYFLIFSLLLVLILSQGICSGADFWIAYWTTQEEIKHSNDSSPLRYTSNNETVHIHSIDSSDLPHYSYQLSNGSYVDASNIYDDYVYKNQIYRLFKTDIAVYIYGFLILMVILFTIARSLMFFKMCMLSSINLHRKMFTSLLAAPMRFFHKNPSGRILNRFSRDMGAVDELLPTTFVQALQVTLVAIGILINVSIANHYAIIALIILGFIFAKIQEVFRSTGKHLKHLEGITKSPVFTYVTSTISGLATIRASKIENVLIGQFDSHQDVNSAAWWLLLAIQFALGVWIDTLCVAFIACIAFSFIAVQSGPKGTDGSMVGLALSQAFILTGMVQFGLRQACEVINNLTSVERVLQYTIVEPEERFEVPYEELQDKYWPNRGVIQFQHLHLKYDLNEPYVLKGLSFTICRAEKVGVVGRTGAGKSSLIAALFRLAPIEGVISIDGVDTQKISLSKLRKKISIIPQEPVLFSGSLRYNLDPFGEFQDPEMWKALEEVELKLAVPSLDFIVSEGGGNFSIGERQLICLARAILRDNRILIMDEATANVDQRTDSLIQDTIRRRFKNRTVITIAHRLNTIMDSDRVLVMSSGRILELDHPHRLLQIHDGHFRRMVLETGPQMAAELEDLASEAYRSKHSA